MLWLWIIGGFVYLSVGFALSMSIYNRVYVSHLIVMGLFWPLMMFSAMLSVAIDVCAGRRPSK